MLYLVILCLSLVCEALGQGSTYYYGNTTPNYHANTTTSHFHDNTTHARLVGGPSNRTGLLQLYYKGESYNRTTLQQLNYKGEWVTVYAPSAYYFTQNDAKVICNMLGYGNSDLAYAFSSGVGNRLFGKLQSSSIANMQFNCQGNEKDVSECSGWSTNMSLWDYTGYSSDVGVACDRSFVRIRDGDTAHSGRVEIFSKGDWHSICDYGFDDEEAKVVCGMLGLNNTGIAKAFKGSLYGYGSGGILISSLSCLGIETNIMDCSPSFGTCDHNSEAGVRCDLTPIRLVNGPTNTSGRVEIFHGGTWGTICGYTNFDQRNVQVLCRMIGVDNPNAFGYPFAFYGEGDSIPIVYNLQCDGSESDITLCQSYAWAASGHTTGFNCDHSYDVGVNCGAETPIRLSDGGTEQSGRLEVFHNGHWGTVSSTGFDNHDLHVVCRMLGFASTSKSFFMPNGYYGQGIGEVLVKDLACNGAEADIGLCGATWWPKTKPGDHSQDVGVNCDGVVLIRLDGDVNSTGRVEVLHNGDYGTVCSTNFDRLDFVVVCRMLGYDNIPKSAYWFEGPTYATGLGEIVVSSLACNGIESGIGQCGGNWPATSSCSHNNDVFVNCGGVPETMRLVDGKSNYSGRVEIYHAGEWGTICDSSFDRADAAVICRILGYQHPQRAVAHTRAQFGAAESHVPIVMTDLHCNGLEKTLGQCNPNWATPSCTHNQDIGVDCCPNCQAAIIG